MSPAFSPGNAPVASHVFPRNATAPASAAVAGDGPWIIDDRGRRYLDACGGAAVSCLGHSNVAVREAVKTQLDKIAWAHTSFFTSQPAELLAERLIARAPTGIERVYFVSGGSEAIEAALKLARQYFVERGEPQRRHVIARWQSYHGNTIGALSAGGNRWRRQQFEPLLSEAMSHIEPCHYWRWGASGESPQDYGLRAADLLEKRILECEPGSVAAFIAEPVVGATMGAVPATPGYFKRIREICDRHGVLLILDEVMCGMGRTGTWFACEQDGIVPDIVCVAKGLGAGVQPIGAMLCTADIFDTITGGSGFFQHGHTYLGHPTACAAGVAVLDEVDRHNWLDNVQTMGARLHDALTDRFGQHPHVGDIRGRGLFLGLELVADRNEKTPFDPNLKLHARIKRAAFDNGLMVYPMGGTIDGHAGDHVLLAPPYIIDETHIGLIIDGLAQAIDNAIESLAT